MSYYDHVLRPAEHAEDVACYIWWNPCSPRVVLLSAGVSVFRITNHRLDEAVDARHVPGAPRGRRCSGGSLDPFLPPHGRRCGPKFLSRIHNRTPRA
jgi:hypothetical protein